MLKTVITVRSSHDYKVTVKKEGIDIILRGFPTELKFTQNALDYIKLCFDKNGILGGS